MSSSVLNVEDLHVRFPGIGSVTAAVRGCSMQVRRGEIMGLVGESGSGKSMMAMSCLGLVPNPGEVTGTIKVDNIEVDPRVESNMEQVRGNHAAMIFQNPMSALCPFIRIGDQLLDAINSGSGQNAARQDVIEALASVFLPDPESLTLKYPHQLSGGQLQRVMIAMAIACKPSILIADEPTTALDVTIQAQILLLIQQLARQNQIAVLFITHDLGVVASICDRVSVMYAGKIVEAGTVDEIFNMPKHPYTEKLLRTTPAIGHSRSALEHIPGQVPDMAHLPEGCAFHNRCHKATAQCSSIDPGETAVTASHYVSCHLHPSSGQSSEDR